MKNLRLTFGKPNVCHIKGMEKNLFSKISSHSPNLKSQLNYLKFSEKIFFQFNDLESSEEL